VTRVAVRVVDSRYSCPVSSIGGCLAVARPIFFFKRAVARVSLRKDVEYKCPVSTSPSLC
jgi:hypothetical protein